MTQKITAQDQREVHDSVRLEVLLEQAIRERDEARGTNERWERIKALTDTVRLDTLWQELVAQRDKFKRERDEALSVLREWLELYEEDIADQSYMGPLNRTKAVLAKNGAKP